MSFNGAFEQITLYILVRNHGLRVDNNQRLSLIHWLAKLKLQVSTIRFEFCLMMI